MENVIVTTVRKPNPNLEFSAEETAKKIGANFFPRKDFSIEVLKNFSGAKNILVAKKNSLVLLTEEGEFFFHPGTSHLRIKNLRSGLSDRLVDAAQIKPGDKILDCTLGPGSDAIVESFAAGESGKVIALEINPVIAEVVRSGMKNFSDDVPQILDAMRRVEVVTANYFDFLKSAGDKTFDAVYFDPMFIRPIEKSSGMNPIRSLASHELLSPEAVREACRVARRRVVMKSNAGSGEFERLGFKISPGGKYSSVAFGFIEV